MHIHWGLRTHWLLTAVCWEDNSVITRKCWRNSNVTWGNYWIWLVENQGQRYLCYYAPVYTFLTNVLFHCLLVIKDWSVSAPYSHLAGGMKYHDGKLTVPTPGRYYIYAQLYYHSHGRVYVEVNSKPITMIQPPTSGGGHGALYAGGVFNLKAGDVITLRASNYESTATIIYMYTFHSYFGAYLIWAEMLTVAWSKVHHNLIHKRDNDKVSLFD